MCKIKYLSSKSPFFHRNRRFPLTLTLALVDTKRPPPHRAPPTRSITDRSKRIEAATFRRLAAGSNGLLFFFLFCSLFKEKKNGDINLNFKKQIFYAKMKIFACAKIEEDVMRVLPQIQLYKGRI